MLNHLKVCASAKCVFLTHYYTTHAKPQPTTYQPHHQKFRLNYYTVHTSEKDNLFTTITIFQDRNKRSHPFPQTRDEMFEYGKYSL